MTFTVLESGAVPIGGSTTGLVKRSLTPWRDCSTHFPEEVKDQATTAELARAFPLAAFIADAKSIASLGASAKGCGLAMPEVDARVAIAGNLDQLLAALLNLLQNAFKFTHPRTEVTPQAYAEGDRAHIDAQGHCGGLPARFAEKMFKPFTQGGFDRSGSGLGLSIARRTLEKELPGWTSLSQ